jgi:septal ring factor EnvC (AmiA/AmiB activator)
MPGNSIAISRELLAAGVEEKTAAAVAEAIVTHSDERHATREDLVKMEATIKEKTQDEINALRNDISNVEVNLAKLEAKVDAMGEKMDAEARRNDTRFNILGGFMVANFAVVFALVLQNLFGG